MIVTNFAWGKRYLAEQDRLRDSVHQWAIPAVFHRRDYDEPSCRPAAWRLKPQVILFELLVHDQVVWADADGVFRGQWGVELRGDLMVARNRGKWETCTVYSGRTDAALATLETWRDLMPAEFTGFDSEAFQQAVEMVGPEIHELPVEYYWVRDWHYSSHGNRQPVIEYNTPLEIESRCCL